MVYVDNFTLVAFVVSVLLFFSVVVLALRTSRTNRATIGELERRLETVSAHNPLPTDSARHLCCAIRRLHPNAQVGLDFHLGDDGEGAYIREWLMPVPEPDVDRLQQALEDHHRELEVGTYRRERSAAYPAVSDQLDAMYKARHGDPADLEAIDELIRRVKCTYPKPGDCERECPE